MYLVSAREITQSGVEALASAYRCFTCDASRFEKKNRKDININSKFLSRILGTAGKLPLIQDTE